MRSKVKEACDELGLDIELRTLEDSTATVQDAAVAIGCEPGQIAKSIVFVIHDDRVERRAVGVGSTIGDSTEVLSGVSAGERVVVDGPQTLKDGDKVKVQ